jgi:hypothetical protein
LHQRSSKHTLGKKSKNKGLPYFSIPSKSHYFQFFIAFIANDRIFLFGFIHVREDRNAYYSKLKIYQLVSYPMKNLRILEKISEI